MPNNFKMMIIIVSGVFIFIMGTAIVVWVAGNQDEKDTAEQNTNTVNRAPATTIK